MTALRLLASDGSTQLATLQASMGPAPDAAPSRSRIAYAAAHVVPVAWGDNVPGAPAEIDWDATLAFRHHVWSTGLGVADAMDTAQRNMGMDWSATAEDAGAQGVLMASRHLARAAADSRDYVHVYDEVLRRAQQPVILHWLGEAFDASLRGYFGADLSTAMRTVEEIIGTHQDRISGIKMSLLDAEAEITLRRRLPTGVTMFTGDDYNYVRLIKGDEVGHSDALLGAFAAFPATAARALAALDVGDDEQYMSLLGPTEALARQIFAAPTQYYKSGVAFLSWLNGHQPAFSMVGGLHAARSLPHLSEIVRLANESSVLLDPELAAQRWHALLSLHGL